MLVSDAATADVVAEVELKSVHPEPVPTATHDIFSGCLSDRHLQCCGATQNQDDTEMTLSESNPQLPATGNENMAPRQNEVFCVV